MNACAMFGYWGLFTWIPAYLALPVAEGGRGLDLMKTTVRLVIMGVGKWLGYAPSASSPTPGLGGAASYVAYPPDRCRPGSLFGMAERRSGCSCSGPSWRSSGPAPSRASALIASELFPTEVPAPPRWA